jgi:hypothetical protein
MKHGNLEMISYLIINKCPHSIKLYKIAKNKEHINVLKWLKENNHYNLIYKKNEINTF